MKRLIRIGTREAVLTWTQQNGTADWRLCGNDGSNREGSSDIVEVEPGVYSVLVEGRSFEIKVTRRGEAWAVDVNGRHFLVEVLDPREAGRCGSGAGAAGPQKLTAPMPGKVVRVLVEPGTPVEAGQGVVVVEAMKMQNEVKAPRAGRVVSVHTETGATVGAGQVLAVVE